DLVAFLDVDCTPHSPLEARVEQPGRVVQKGTLEKRQLDHALVGLAGTDTPVVGPHGRSRARGFRPLPLLDDLRVCFLDDSSHLAELVAAPVAQLADPLVDQLGRTRLVGHWRIVRSAAREARRCLAAPPASSRPAVCPGATAAHTGKEDDGDHTEWPEHDSWA